MEKEKFTVKFASTKAENEAAFALRYRDMLLEYRADAVCDDGLDFSPYDAYAKQVICIDNETGEVVGCYRVVVSDALPSGEKFVCEEEFDITSLKATGGRIAELSRAVIKKEYRNSVVLMLLLRFIVQYIRGENIRFIIGEASFFGTDKTAYQKELSYLAHEYAIKEYEIRSREEKQVPILPKESLDLAGLKRSLPPLIRAYLGFGALVSSDSYTDWEFGSVDVFILMDTKNCNEAYINRLLRL